MKTHYSSVNNGYIISVAGPSGGVGRTSMSALLAQGMAASGLKVLLVDGDYGLGKFENIFGLEVKYHLEDYLFSDIPFSLIMGKIESGITLVASGHGHCNVANMSPSTLDGFMLRLEQVKSEYDFVIIDNGPGIHAQQLEAIKYADLNLIITTPQLSTVLDSLYFLKVAGVVDVSSKCGVIVNKVKNLKEANDTFLKLDAMSKKCDCPVPLFLGHYNIDTGASICSPILLADYFKNQKKDNQLNILEMISLIKELKVITNKAPVVAKKALLENRI